jgi:hypothetical protein
MTGHPSLLLPFDLVREKVGMKSSSYDGIREIEIAKVIGSVSRYDEFDREFLPKRWETAERWTRIRKVLEEGWGFEPIKVYQVGEAYFVEDGNHRVSVAKRLGAKTIEAEVTRFEPTVPIDERTNIRSLIVKAEYSDFLRATGLDEKRPQQQIEFTRPGRYAVLLEHIEKHRYFKMLDGGCPVSDDEAVTSWFDTVYEPLVEIFRTEGMLAAFPGRTEADLYVWVSKHLYLLREQTGGEVRVIDAARDFAARYSLPRALRFLEGLRTWPTSNERGRAGRRGK